MSESGVAPLGFEVLTVAEHAAADRLANEDGVSGEALMEAAGRGVAAEICARWTPRPVSVLCGPGNNGGDGFVAARVLAAAGWPVRVALLGGPAERQRGDAATAAARWDGRVEALTPTVVESAGLVVDALFGAGLARPIDGAAVKTLQAVDARRLPCVAVDLPSGVHGDTGATSGTVAQAALTVTFFRAKPAHLLLPARALCGELAVIDIGTPWRAVDAIQPRLWRNEPSLWAGAFPWPAEDAHKYLRGHAVIRSGGVADTGAARLAALAAARVGAGLVTIACPRDALPALAGAVTEILLAPADGAGKLSDLLTERRRNAVLVGPANRVTDGTRRETLAALAARLAAVIDADALTVFAGAPQDLFDAVDETCVLTPHDGEFGRLFTSIQETGRLARARAAARMSGAVVALKGPDSVVAHPDGRAAIASNASPHLATAGTGDVLAGLILGLRAQGMPPFEAAAAAVWLHGEAAARFGPGLLAGDLPAMLPSLLRELRAAAGPHPGAVDTARQP